MDDEFGDWGECSSEFVVVDFEGKARVNPIGVPFRWFLLG